MHDLEREGLENFTPYYPAKELPAKLRAEVRAQIDCSNLAQVWDRAIERAIAKEIEYFVVLQSQAMTAKYESYFYKELRLALKRQKSFRERIDFIIPTKIDDCPLLEELRHLQTVDLSDKANVKELISIIKRDQQRRNRK